MTGEAVHEVILAAVGLVGDDHDVAPFRQDGMAVAPVLGEELLDGGEDHAARGHRQLGPEIGAACRLRWRLPQQVLAAGKGPEELVVQIVAVGDDDDGGTGHGQLPHGGSGVEGHGQALA